MLSGCQTKPLIVTREVAVLIPDSLLVSPCKAMEAGETVRTLAKGYIVNTNCLYQHQTNLEDIRKWKQEKEKLYNADTIK